MLFQWVPLIFTLALPLNVLTIIYWKLPKATTVAFGSFRLYSFDFQALLQYSTWGSTSILYKLSITLVSLNLIVLLIIPNTLVALL